ncbi:unnamed protein product [Gongylonema pulchrum]|uniref:Conserved oligomeric Golgi complex subunit 1 n=1 Tax=Gongylonema pulchrum TaxID=637853 RepID=A0A183D7E5_9BILA|nr:unnamed protein product [Gongylonema pulchrum]
MAALNAVSDGSVVSEDQFTEEEFDATLYVWDQLKDMKSGDEMRQLHALRSRLNAINIQSSESMKKSVFTNYQKFIDTAKDVSRQILRLHCLVVLPRFILGWKREDMRNHETSRRGILPEKACLA